ncbi:MAG: hypothetical protein V1826_01040 [bacterium]
MSKLLIFTEGTILIHSESVGHARNEIIQQNLDQIPNIKEYSEYIPIGNAPAKVAEWQANGYEICYLTSRRKPEEIADIQGVLDRYNFPEAPLYYRQGEETYGDAATRIMPDIIVDDTCESIGVNEITWTQLTPDIQNKIKPYIVPEFFGVDHLPTIL